MPVGGAGTLRNPHVPLFSRVEISRVDFCSATEKVFAKNVNETQVFGGFIQI